MGAPLTPAEKARLVAALPDALDPTLAARDRALEREALARQTGRLSMCYASEIGEPHPMSPTG